MTNFLYNPDRKSREQLIAEFVVRNNVLDEIMHDLESSDMKMPEQHYLLVGQRGSGKTTLLNRIKYAVEDSEKLKGWLIPVIFSEEQYNITELANLWENVAQVLEDYHGFEGLMEEMEKFISRDNFEELAYDVLERELRRRSKKIVLLIDNIPDLLKKLEDNEARRLREILQTKSDLRLIAGSTFYLESLLDYKQPLFEFLKVMRLDGLSEKETEILLRKLGEVSNEEKKINGIIVGRPERIETLRVLTGGVPRTIALMFRIFIDYEHESSIRDLEKILDAVTPLYKHRMDDLPTQQQKIMDAVAKYWDPISVKEIKAKIRLDSKTISSQLRQLEKNQIISKRGTNTKNHLYLITERFFNIWYLMRHGRKSDKQRVVWLVRFLESWCSHADIEKKVFAFVAEIKARKISDENIAFFADVYSAVKNLSLNAKIILKQSDNEKISSKIQLSEPELVNLAETAFKNQDFTSVLKWLAYLKTLNLGHKKLVVDSIWKIESKKNKTHALKELYPDEIHFSDITNGRLEIIAIWTLMSVVGLLESEQSPEAMKEHFALAVSIFTLLYTRRSKVMEDEADISLELLVLTMAFKKAYEKSLISTIIDLLEKTRTIEFVDEHIAVDLRVILQPIYHALLIIENRITYTQIPPEKEQLIRNIVAQITSKD